MGSEFHSCIARPMVFRPNDVALSPDSGPLVSVFGLCETEYAVARVVLACRRSNRWRAVTLQEIRDACESGPWNSSWATIGNIEDDLREAIAHGWVERIEGGRFELTTEAIERLASKARR